MKQLLENSHSRTWATAYLDVFANIYHALGNQVLHVNAISDEAVDYNLDYAGNVAIVHS